MKMKTMLIASAALSLAALSVGATNGLPADAWYTDAVTKAVESGFISYENDTFTEGEPATVADVNTAVRVIAALEGSDYLPILEEAADAPATRGYLCSMLGMMYMVKTDAQPETHYLPDMSIFDGESDYIFMLYDIGVLCGDESGCFNGDAMLTKEEFAAIITRYLYPECRVKANLPAGVSARDAFGLFDGELTEDDETAYASTDTGFVLTKAMYDYASSVQGEESADGTLSSLAAIEKLLYLYDFRVSEDMFVELKSYYSDDWAQAVSYIAEQGFDVSPYAYYQNYVLSNYYDAVSADFLYHAMPTYHEIYLNYGGSYVLAKHILIQSGGTEEGKAAALEKITEIKKQLDEGADFDALMTEYGEDPGMKQTPGGYCFTRGEMVEPFENAAFALKENEMSGIVETDYGYHIILRLPLTEEIFCSNTDLCDAIAYYEAYGAWQNVCSIVAETVSLEKK